MLDYSCFDSYILFARFSFLVFYSFLPRCRAASPFPCSHHGHPRSFITLTAIHARIAVLLRFLSLIGLLQRSLAYVWPGRFAHHSVGLRYPVPVQEHRVIIIIIHCAIVWIPWDKGHTQSCI